MGIFDSIFGGGGGSASLPDIEDLRPLMQAQADINRLDQHTPFGSYTFNKVGPKPMEYNEWLKQNPGPTTPQRQSIFGQSNQADDGGFGSPINRYDPRKAYDKYASGFGDQKTEARFNFSPELQSLFDKQFSEDAYQGYADDYMGRYTQLLDPYRQQETDRFQQSMVNRGIPEGSDVYGDYYRPIGDQRSRADLMAAQAAQGTADNRIMQDYNRLITAMGGSAIPYQPVDVMGPANMSLNAQMSNAANAQQQSSDMWNTAATLGSAFFLSSKSLKDRVGGTDTLNALMSIPVERWKYKGDGIEHVGAYAEDFQQAFDLGDGKSISVIDAIGVLMRAVQELTEEVRNG